MGKEKDGSVCFKVPDKKDLDAYLSTVETFGKNVFKFGSSSGSQRSVVFFLFLPITVTNHSDGMRMQLHLWAVIFQSLPMVLFLIILIGETLQGEGGQGFQAPPFLQRKYNMGT